MGETSYWDVARRRWQVVVAFAQLGVGIALVASSALDSPRPIRDIVIGLVSGLAAGLIVVRPVEQLAEPSPGRGRHSRHPAGRRATQRMVIVEAAQWPKPEISEYPTPTFARPGRR